MAALRNPRHEKVAQLVAKGEPGTRAYAVVYEQNCPRAAGASAARLLADARVAARVAELQEAATAAVVKEIAYDRAAAMAEAGTALAMALERGQLSAAVTAITLRAKLSGLLIEKSEVKQVNPLDGMSPADLASFVARLERAAAVEGLGAIAGNA
jgi:hypothetical protein